MNRTVRKAAVIGSAWIALSAVCYLSVCVSLGAEAKPKLPRIKVPVDYPTPKLVIDTSIKLPQEAAVYKVKRTPVTEDVLRKMARLFGMPEFDGSKTPPRGKSGIRTSVKRLLVTPDHVLGFYNIDSPGTSLTVRDDGFVEYGIADVADAAAPSEEEANALAMSMLDRLGLVPKGAQLKCEAAGYRKRCIITEQGSDSLVTERTVRCCVHIPGSPIEGSYIDLEIGAGGKLHGLTRYITEVEPFQSYPLKDASEVIEDMVKGRALHVDVDTEYAVKFANIHAVRVVYHEPRTLDRVLYVLPTYVLTGETSVGGKKLPFTAEVIAVKNEFMVE